MHHLLKEEITNKFQSPVNSSKDCSRLADIIYTATKRKISATTLRRFYGLMPNKSAFSKYNLDTLSIYSGKKDYKDFLEKTSESMPDHTSSYKEIKNEFDQITNYTLNSISRKSLTNFKQTIARNIVNIKLNTFLDSDYSIFPIIAPGGYGKSTALAHWVHSLDRKKNHVLFCSAEIFYQQFSSENALNQTLRLKLTNNYNFYNSFEEKGNEASKKIIIILDALEEITNEKHKLKSIADYISEVSNKSSSIPFLKIVFSISESIWKKVAEFNFDKTWIKEAIAIDANYSDKFISNFPELTNSEIREILLNFNDGNDLSLIYECIPWDVREIIRIPLNLHYFNVLFKKKTRIEAITRNQLMREYLKGIIFQSKFAEQKEDILWKVIELLESKDNNFLVRKNDIREFYPIHLKRETHYYQAYNDLIINNVFIEERIENKYGIFVSYIGFKHQNLYYQLSALNQINKNGGLDFELLSSISKNTEKEEWSIQIIAILFEIAYDTADYETLKDFCELPNNIVSSQLVRIAVGSSFRKQNTIREKLMQKFAASSNGQMYFFEQFVDINYLFNNFECRIAEYLKHKNDHQSQLFGNGILYLAGFLKMNKKLSEKYFLKIDVIKAKTSIHPWPIGRKVAYSILHKYFIEKNVIEKLDEYIISNSNIASSYDNKEKGLIEFELPVMISLVLIKEYAILEKVIENALHTHKQKNGLNKENNILRNAQNSLPYLFLEYAKYKQGKTITYDLPNLWVNAIRNYTSTFDDFQYLILLNWFICDYYISNNQIDKSLSFYSSALEISQLAGYDFFYAFLLKNDPEKKSGNIALADEMISLSEFNPAFFVR